MYCNSFISTLDGHLYWFEFLTTFYKQCCYKQSCTCLLIHLCMNLRLANYYCDNFLKKKIPQITVSYNVNIYVLLVCFKGFPRGSVVKNLPANAGDTILIPGSRRSPKEGTGNPFQYSCWGIPWTEEPGELQSMGSQKNHT